VGLDGTWAAIELKYPRDRYEWVSPIDPVPYQRGSRDAADNSVYSVVNDLARTERWVAAGAADLNLVIVQSGSRRGGADRCLTCLDGEASGPQEDGALLAHGTGWMSPYQGDGYFEYGALDRA
jgi:hypothetical protein